MRRRSRVDGPHAAIRDALREIGVLVCDTSRVGDGYGDLLTFHPRERYQWLEVKTNGKAKLGELQEQRLRDGWPIHRVESVAQALCLFGVCESRSPDGDGPAHRVGRQT